MTLRLVAENLACERGGRVLFSGLSFAVASGEALLVTGPNGAGKSSLLRLLAGLLRPAAGGLRLEGGDGELLLSEQVHYLGHLDAVKPALGSGETLAISAALLGGGGLDPHEALEAVGLDGLADLPAGVLSAGQRRRLALARLLVARRPVWLLDEPTAALDAASQRRLVRIIEDHLAAGGLAVIATHDRIDLARATALTLGGAS